MFGSHDGHALSNSSEFVNGGAKVVLMHDGVLHSHDVVFFDQVRKAGIEVHKIIELHGVVVIDSTLHQDSIRQSHPG